MEWRKKNLTKMCLTKTQPVLLSKANMTSRMRHEKSICIGLSGRITYPANSYISQNPCIMAGLPVAHKYSSKEIQITFDNLHKPSSKSICIEQAEETASIMKRHASNWLLNSISWMENFLYFFNLKSLWHNISRLVLGTQVLSKKIWTQLLCNSHWALVKQ